MPAATTGSWIESTEPARRSIGGAWWRRPEVRFWRSVRERARTFPSTGLPSGRWRSIPEPDFRHAGIDVFLAGRAQGSGLGTDAVRTLARYLIHERGHHRLTIDPAADNAAAIRAYEKVGFRAVGVMRQYWRSPEG